MDTVTTLGATLSGLERRGNWQESKTKNAAIRAIWIHRGETDAGSMPQADSQMLLLGKARHGHRPGVLSAYLRNF